MHLKIRHIAGLLILTALIASCSKQNQNKGSTTSLYSNVQMLYAVHSVEQLKSSDEKIVHTIVKLAAEAPVQSVRFYRIDKFDIDKSSDLFERYVNDPVSVRAKIDAYLAPLHLPIVTDIKGNSAGADLADGHYLAVAVDKEGNFSRPMQFTVKLADTKHIVEKYSESSNAGILEDKWESRRVYWNPEARILSVYDNEKKEANITVPATLVDKAVPDVDIRFVKGRGKQHEVLVLSKFPEEHRYVCFKMVMDGDSFGVFRALKEGSFNDLEDIKLATIQDSQGRGVMFNVIRDKLLYAHRYMEEEGRFDKARTFQIRNYTTVFVKNDRAYAARVESDKLYMKDLIAGTESVSEPLGLGNAELRAVDALIDELGIHIIVERAMADGTWKNTRAVAFDPVSLKFRKMIGFGDRYFDYAHYNNELYWLRDVRPGEKEAQLFRLNRDGTFEPSYRLAIDKWKQENSRLTFNIGADGGLALEYKTADRAVSRRYSSLELLRIDEPAEAMEIVEEWLQWPRNAFDPPGARYSIDRMGENFRIENFNSDGTAALYKKLSAKQLFGKAGVTINDLAVVDGKVFLATTDGWYSFNKNTDDAQLQGPEVYHRLYCLPNANLFVGTTGNKFYVIDPATRKSVEYGEYSVGSDFLKLLEITPDRVVFWDRTRTTKQIIVLGGGKVLQIIKDVEAASHAWDYKGFVAVKRESAPQQTLNKLLASPVGGGWTTYDYDNDNDPFSHQYNPVAMAWVKALESGEQPMDMVQFGPNQSLLLSELRGKLSVLDSSSANGWIEELPEEDNAEYRRFSFMDKEDALRTLELRGRDILFRERE